MDKRQSKKSLELSTQRMPGAKAWHHPRFAPERGSIMKLWQAAGIAGICVLAGCAGGKAAFAPGVSQGVTEGGAKTVAVELRPLACLQQTRCTELGASWTGAKPALAVLTVKLPGQGAEVTGADFHFGSGDPVRVRSRSATAPQGQGGTAFDVPLPLIERIAFASRSWVKVYTADGRSTDETINSGDEAGRAVESLNHFLAAVSGAGGKVQGSQGLLERLGMGENK